MLILFLQEPQQNGKQKCAFRTTGDQKDTEAWTFLHTISLTTEELLRKTYYQNLVAIYVFGTQILTEF